MFAVIYTQWNTKHQISGCTVTSETRRLLIRMFDSSVNHKHIIRVFYLYLAPKITMLHISSDVHCKVLQYFFACIAPFIEDGLHVMISMIMRLSSIFLCVLFKDMHVASRENCITRQITWSHGLSAAIVGFESYGTFPSIDKYRFIYLFRWSVIFDIGGDIDINVV